MKGEGEMKTDYKPYIITWSNGETSIEHYPVDIETAKRELMGMKDNDKVVINIREV